MSKSGLRSDPLLPAAEYHGVDPRDLDTCDLIAWALNVGVEDFFCCDDDHVPKGIKGRLQTDTEAWAGLQESTRQAALILAAMRKSGGPVGISTMCRIAEHVAPDDPVAVLCLFGVIPPPPHTFTEEQTRALHVCARTAMHIAQH